MSQRIWITGLWVGTIAVVVGCSGKKPPAEAPATAPTAAVAPAAAGGTAPAPTTGMPPAPAPQPAVAQTVDPNRPETKWIGTIPYDVFYDQPLVVASDATAVGGAPASGSPTPGTVAMKPADGDTTPAEVKPAAAGSATDWAKVLPLEMALEAVKVARNEINANLQGVPKYNAGMPTIRLNAALIGMLSMVVAEHPEAANWKEKAKYIRDLCYKIQSTATEKGSGGHKATQEIFEQITGMLDGGKPPEMESADNVPYVDVADRADMMKIIEKSVNDLKSNIGDAKRMKDQAGEVSRQLAVLQTIGVMMGDQSYDQADDPQYQEYTKNFIDGAAMGTTAVKDDKFDEFQSALSKMNTSCGDCHPKFRGGSE